MLTYIEEIDKEVDLGDSELEDTLCEQLDAYCEDLSKQDGMTRPVNEDDCYDTKPLFMWTDKASRMIEREICRLWTIANKYYTETEMDEITVETSWYTEY